MKVNVLWTYMSGDFGHVSMYEFVKELSQNVDEINLFCLQVDEKNKEKIQNLKKDGFIKDFHIKKLVEQNRSGLGYLWLMYTDVFLPFRSHVYFEWLKHLVNKKYNGIWFNTTSAGGFYMFKFLKDYFKDSQTYLWTQELPQISLYYFNHFQNSFKFLRILHQAIFGTFYDWIFRSLINKYVDRLFTLSEWSKETIYYFYGRESEVITSLNTKDFHKFELEEEDIEQQKIIDSIGKYILISNFSITIDKHKKFIANIAHDKSIKILSFGNRPLQNVENIIDFGYVSENIKKYLYQNAEAYLGLFDYEGFGLMISESMMLGTPVLTTNFGAPAEISNNIYSELTKKEIDLMNFSNSYTYSQLQDKIKYIFSDKYKPLTKKSRSEIQKSAIHLYDTKPRKLISDIF